MRSRLDLSQLKDEIKVMKPGNQLYIVLKEALSQQEHWKNKPRGKPQPAWYFKHS